MWLTLIWLTSSSVTDPDSVDPGSGQAFEWVRIRNSNVFRAMDPTFNFSANPDPEPDPDPILHLNLVKLISNSFMFT